MSIMLILVIMLLGSTLFVVGATALEHVKSVQEVFFYRYKAAKEAALRDGALLLEELERET